MQVCRYAGGAGEAGEAGFQYANCCLQFAAFSLQFSGLQHEVLKFRFPGSKVCRFAGCGFAGLQFCRFAAMELCSFAALQLCNFAALQLLQVCR